MDCPHLDYEVSWEISAFQVDDCGNALMTKQEIAEDNDWLKMKGGTCSIVKFA